MLRCSSVRVQNKLVYQSWGEKQLYELGCTFALAWNASSARLVIRSCEGGRAIQRISVKGSSLVFIPPPPARYGRWWWAPDRVRRKQQEVIKGSHLFESDVGCVLS